MEVKQVGEDLNVIPSKSHLDHGMDIPKSPNYEKDIPINIAEIVNFITMSNNLFLIKF